MSENRLLTRSICADLVHLDWKEKSDWGGEAWCECAAVLEDISSRGACLQVETPVPVDIQATIRNDDRWSAHCKVKYCEYREIGYFVGIEFADTEAWSRFQFQPQHLLDLSELVRGSE